MLETIVQNSFEIFLALIFYALEFFPLLNSSPKSELMFLDNLTIFLDYSILEMLMVG